MERWEKFAAVWQACVKETEALQGTEFRISHNVRKSLDKDTALFILDRADKLAACTLEQLRKSTDRAYTLFGLLLTAFSAVTGLLLAADADYAILIPGGILWVGLGVSLYIMFSKAIWVHQFRNVGNEPENMISERNIERLMKSSGANASKVYERYAIFDSIEDDAYAIKINDIVLDAKVRVIRRVMKTLKATMCLVAFSALAVFLFRLIA